MSGDWSSDVCSSDLWEQRRHKSMTSSWGMLPVSRPGPALANSHRKSHSGAFLWWRMECEFPRTKLVMQEEPKRKGKRLSQEEGRRRHKTPTHSIDKPQSESMTRSGRREPIQECLREPTTTNKQDTSGPRPAHPRLYASPPYARPAGKKSPTNPFQQNSQNKG